LGFPHDPQGPAARGEVDAPELDRAENTDNCCSSLLLWQDGHSGFFDPMTSASNS
jgi:hypothetical protein